jgi:hypothetical protein
MKYLLIALFLTGCASAPQKRWYQCNSVGPVDLAYLGEYSSWEEATADQQRVLSTATAAQLIQNSRFEKGDDKKVFIFCHEPTVLKP